MNPLAISISKVIDIFSLVLPQQQLGKLLVHTAPSTALPDSAVLAL
jgi:hypothetical protein